MILDHFQGRHVVGVYPLLADETCWFLAADFDKASWTDDVAAFVETCRQAGLPAAVERSRSGNGAHVWFFFSAPVAAAVARKMGCYLITETMTRRHQLGMDSYDRLFPNQDTLPRGGFGNLIALPLQHGPRQMGNTVFVDDQLVALPDQWKFLSEHPCIDPATVDSIAHEATRKGLVVGVRVNDSSDIDNTEPWAQPPSGQLRVRFSAPLTPEVRAVLAQRLFVAKAGLAASHLNQIKRLAAFQNPEFYKKQSLRLSTALTPRVVACAEDLPEHVALPRGCHTDLEQMPGQHGSSLRIEDQRREGTSLNVRFEGQLTATKKKAARVLLREDIGVLVAPPGAGKTVIGTYLIAARCRSTLVLVHRQPLLDRVDRLADGSYEVVDYKTGALRLPGGLDATFAGGRQLQHALYALAATELLRTTDSTARVSSGSYYFPTRRGRSRRVSRPQGDRGNIAAVLADLFDVVAGGTFIHTTSDDDCTFCQFPRACGRDPVARAAAKVEDESNAALAAYRRLGAHA